MGTDAAPRHPVSEGPAVGRAMLEDALSALDKTRLHAVADGLLRGDAECLGFAVRFLELESRGIWHGRARAMFARRLKHCVIGDRDRERVARVVRGRLASGVFSEQFKDQLKLLIHWRDPELERVARGCRQDARAHVRRYAEWVLARCG